MNHLNAPELIGSVVPSRGNFDTYTITIPADAFENAAKELLGAGVIEGDLDTVRDALVDRFLDQCTKAGTDPARVYLDDRQETEDLARYVARARRVA